MSMTSFEINGRRVGGGASPYMIAELGINHGGDLDMALRLLDEAKARGADAAKLQAFTPELFMARSSPYYDLLASCALKRDAIAALMARAREIDVTLFSAVFDEPSADLLAELGAPAFKIASGDLTHLPLLRHVSAFGRPMLVSTGAGALEEVRAALGAIREANAETPVAVFHCVSNYPTSPAEANLACMSTMREEFGAPVGFSDHTQGAAVAIAAAALGAELIEKHFTLDKTAEGPDHALSSDPEEFGLMVESVRAAASAVGSRLKRPVETPELIAAIRRSVTAQVDIPAGAAIEPGMLAVKRPGTGIQPGEMEKLIGRRAVADIAADTTLDWSMVEAG